ncbi:MAG: hypothetical protein KJI71_00980, partial [Patescibacteria group bacterium]|nr:hypothetical protein [Patescibacteria group bacterium]
MSRNIKFFLITLVLSISFFWGTDILQRKLEDFFYAQISEPFQKIAFVKIPEKSKRPKLNILSESAILVKISKTGREKVIFQKDSTRALPIASLTKLMTALIVIENTPQHDYDFSRAVKVSEKAASQKDIPVYGNLKEGEIFSVEKL